MKKKEIETPYYLIDEEALLCNLEKVDFLREKAGVRILLATKCFSSFAVFPLLKKYIDGTSSSSLFETKLGYQKIGKEVVSYCVGYKENEIKEINKMADKIIFNSSSQLSIFCDKIDPEKIGIRINPGVSYSKYDLADPNRYCSRLGIKDYSLVSWCLSRIKGAMFHFNCENEDFDTLKANIEYIEEKYKDVFLKVKWINFGGGIRFTSESFPILRFAILLKRLSDKYGIQIYLEPGEAIVRNSTKLITTVVDIVRNEKLIAIVDASTEAHMLDTLIYQDSPKIRKVQCDDTCMDDYSYQIAGRSCLAGDIFGEYTFKGPLVVGDKLEILDAGAYSIVKKNWFNGLSMPSIVVKRLSGKIEIIRSYKYKDFLRNNS